MGLPLFVSPVETEVASKAAEKTASGPRSAIRRQRTVRGPSARAAMMETRRRRVLSTVVDAAPEEYEVYEMTRRTSPPTDAEVNLTSRRGTQQMLAEAERMREAMSFERRNRSNEPEGLLMMPPVPETRDYYTIRRSELSRLRQRSDLLRLASHPTPRPPYTETDLAFLAEMRSESPRQYTLAPGPGSRPQPVDDVEGIRRRLMEDSSMARRAAHRMMPMGRRSGRSTLSERIMAMSGENNGLGSTTSTERASRQASLDGLGDRDRSLTPEAGGGAWDTILTSITPDPQLPSAGSSFASATAGTSTTAGSGSASAGTSMTSTVPSEETSAIRDCELSDSENEDEDEEEMYGLQEFQTRSSRSWRSYADAVTSRQSRAARRNSADEGDLADMQPIIARLAERDDIPEEWWASAGLTRNLRREPTA